MSGGGKLCRPPPPPPPPPPLQIINKAQLGYDTLMHPAEAVVEMLRTATLVRDDIIDEADTPR